MDAATCPSPADSHRPLLPAALIGHPAILWLWVLPITLLLALNFQGYQLIEGNMDAAQQAQARWLGFLGVGDLLLGLALFVLMRRHARSDSVGWAIPAIIAQVSYLWLATAWSDTLLPRTVTDWIYPTPRYLYNQFAFAMPPLFWGMLRLACARPTATRSRSLLINLGLALAAPLVLYLAFCIGSGFPFLPAAAPQLVALLIIALGFTMLVALIRGLALIFRGLDRWQPAHERFFIVLFALVLPLGGLLLNRTIPFTNDFQAWEVYTLTVANAAILLLASWCHARRPLLSLGLLSATLPFTLYFFVVFLPFLPLSILAVIALGAGFLVLTPTILLILHLSLLNKARLASTRYRWTTALACFLLLPLFFTLRGLADKSALHAALDYLYTPSLTSGPRRYPGNLLNLERALHQHRSYKNGIYYPLLSDYYAWLVFDHLVLPDEKLAGLEKTFFGQSGSTDNTDPLRPRDDFFRGSRSVRQRHHMPRPAPLADTVRASRLETRLQAIHPANTVVTCQLTLHNSGHANAEYRQRLRLPAGIYVSGFRLHINGVPVPGRITEKKTALWVYTMIRDSERRDPGLLFYNSPDELELAVFPVAPTTPSIVELDFLVPAPLPTDALVVSSPDPQTLLNQLAQQLAPQLVPIPHGPVLVDGRGSLGLPPVARTPYLHVIIDRSADNGFDGDLSAALADLKKRFPSPHAPRLTLANYEIVPLASPHTPLAILPLRGAFVADLAIAQALRLHREQDLDAPSALAPPPRPIFVILSRHAQTRAFAGQVTAAWSDLIPALEIHELDASGGFATWSTPARDDAPLLRLGHSMRPWIAGQMTRFAPAAREASLQFWSPAQGSWQPLPSLAHAPANTPWTHAANLLAQQQDHARALGNTALNLKTLVQASRAIGVMIPATSYIVVENTAQWRMLEVSERQKLGQNEALNFREVPAPSWVWLCVGLAIVTLLKRSRCQAWRPC